MIRNIREYFETRIAYQHHPDRSSDRALELATAALLIEVSRADFEVTESERRAIEQAVEKSFGMSREETIEIVSLAEQEVERAISLYEFTSLVDRSFSPEQKRHIVGMLWDVALGDDRLEGREEHLIRKVAKLLHVAHEAFIAEKLAAIDRSEQAES